MENEQKSNMQAKMPKEPMILSSKKKWFWIGIVIATLNSFAGIIYGIALFKEKEYQKEGGMIIGWSIIWFLILAFVITPLLLKSEYFQPYQKQLPFAKQLPLAPIK